MVNAFAFRLAGIGAIADLTGCSRRNSVLRRFVTDGGAHGRSSDVRRGFDARPEQSPDGKVRNRRRYHGQGKRGTVPRIDRDVADVRRAIRDLDAALKQLDRVRNDATLTDLERREMHRTALGLAALAERTIEVALDRPVPG